MKVSWCSPARGRAAVRGSSLLRGGFPKLQPRLCDVQHPAPLSSAHAGLPCAAVWGAFLFEITRCRCSSQESSRGRGLTWAGVVTSAVGFSVEPRFNLPTRQPDSSAATGRKIEQDPQHRKGQGARQSKSSSAGTARWAGGTATTPGVLPRLLCGGPRPTAPPRVLEGQGQGLSFHFLTQA